MEKISNWGSYPQIDAALSHFYDGNQLEGKAWISRGLGRSYGDASLGKHIFSTRKRNRFLHFDTSTGILSCEAGVSFRDISKIFLKRAWAPYVAPGTEYVSMGGAIAAEVHGKNHHQQGAFSNYLISFELLRADGQVYHCSPNENADLFYATIGGMGLTGMILSLQLRLRPISSSWMKVHSQRTQSIDQLIDELQAHQSAPYIAAWFDGFSSDYAGWIQTASILNKEDLEHRPAFPTLKNPIYLPSFTPSGLLNPISMRLYNRLRYWKGSGSAVVPREQFLFPLDRIANWNLLYGKKGLIQYQFVVPLAEASSAIKEILDQVRKSGYHSFLNVMKLMGEASPGLFAFPMQGISLAMDFPRKEGLEKFLDRLDEILIEAGGRIYLVKDARLSAKVFREMYPNHMQFKAFLEPDGPRSMLAERLGIVSC